MTLDIHSPSCFGLVTAYLVRSSSKHITMEYETIDPDFLVPANAHLFKQILLITECIYGGHEPAIAVPPLANIICGHAFYVKVRVVENILGKSQPLLQDKVLRVIPWHALIRLTDIGLRCAWSSSSATR